MCSNIKYFDGLTCQSCDTTKCLSCVSSRTTCTSCVASKIYSSGNCVCRAGKYDDTGICTNCPNKCLVCSSAKVCSYCLGPIW